MKSSQVPVARKEGLVIQETTEEVLVYDLNSNKAHCLNQTAAFVWKSCNGNNSIPEITRLFENEIGSTVQEDLIWLAIDELKNENLVEIDSGYVSVFKGMSRREAVKKVGLGTMIALPVISSLVAPSSAMAQSFISTLGGPCASDLNCAQDTPDGQLACCAFLLPPPPGSPPGTPGTPSGFCFSVGDGECGATN